MRGLKKRLARLENPKKSAAELERAREAARKSRELDEKLRRRFEADAAERGPQWVADVEEASERFNRAVQDAQGAGRDPVLDRAVRVAGDEYQSVHDEGRPPWPEEVRTIYFEEQDALPLADCEDCGLDIPVRPGKSGVRNGRVVTIEPARRCFDECPRCGGCVGYEAYYAKHKRQPLGQYPRESGQEA